MAKLPVSEKPSSSLQEPFFANPGPGERCLFPGMGWSGNMSPRDRRRTRMSGTCVNGTGVRKVTEEDWR